MHIRFHTAAAIVVLVGSGLWVASGRYTFVGSDVSIGGDAAAAQMQTSAAGGQAPSKAQAADQTAAGSKAQAAPAALQTVAFIVAKPQPYERQIRLSGQTEADKRVTLVARASGAIAQLPATEGAHMPQNGLVMALDAPEKLAAVTSAQAQFDTAVHQADTSQQLYARGALPQLQYNSVIASREATRSALESAKAEVDRLEIHAPFAGIIDKVLVETGAWVQPGTEVATLLSLDPIVVVGEIGERDLQSVAKGTKASVTFGDGTTAEGEVRYVQREASGVTRTYPIEVAIANPDAAIPAGMSAEIDLSAKTAPAVILPRSVVTLDAAGNLGVKVLTDTDTVAFLKVEIVDDTPTGMVLAGIAPETRIIVSGQNMVGDGQKVAAVETADAAAATGGSN